MRVSGAGTDTTFGGKISETGFGQVALTKTVGGTLTLTGTNIYTGATTVSAGVLRVNGSLDVSALFFVAGDFLGTPTVTLTLDAAGLDYLTVQFIPAPEPGPVLAVAAAGVGLVRLRRRVFGAAADAGTPG